VLSGLSFLLFDYAQRGTMEQPAAVQRYKKGVILFKLLILSKLKSPIEKNKTSLKVGLPPNPPGGALDHS